MRRAWLSAALVIAGSASAILVGEERYANNYVATAIVRLNDNGAWSWFMDPRVIIDGGKLIAGSVRAVGSNQANTSDPRWGNVEISVYDIEAGKVDTVVLHPHLEQDDHDAPAFYVRKDGRYLAVYSMWLSLKARPCAVMLPSPAPNVNPASPCGSDAGRFLCVFS